MGLWGERGEGVVHKVENQSTLWKLLDRAIKAYEARTQVLQQQSVEIGLISNRLELIHGIVFELQQFNGKVERFMATQEERLQVIATKIDEVLADLAALKANNPQIEDEISAIEAKLSITKPEPTPEV